MRTLIFATFFVIALIWLLKNSTQFQAVAGSVSDVFTKGVGALVPKQ